MKKVVLFLSISFILLMCIGIGFTDAIKMQQNEQKYKKTNKTRVMYLHAKRPRLKILNKGLTCPMLNVKAPHPFIKKPSPLVKAPHPPHKLSPDE